MLCCAVQVLRDLILDYLEANNSAKLYVCGHSLGEHAEAQQWWLDTCLQTDLLVLLGQTATHKATVATHSTVPTTVMSGCCELL
jgi:hypothetical protein